MTEDEQTLIASCLKGEKAAWDALVQQYSNLVYHAIRKTLLLHHADPHDDAIEDLYQEFFVTLVKDSCKNLARFRGDRGCTLASWLRLVASRLTIDFLRRQPAPTAEVPETLASGRPDTSESLIKQEEETALAQALESLPSRDRLLIKLSCQEGISPKEIAALLKISVGAFYTQKSRILAKLRDLLQGSGSP